MSISQLNVKILSHTPDIEKLIATAAKLCYSPSNIEDLFENQSKEKSIEFINRLIGMGHFSPIEHATFTFGIEGVSRSLTHQLVRHRIASYSQQSQRYVKEEQFDFIIPEEIKNNDLATRAFMSHMRESQRIYDIITNLLKIDLKKENPKLSDSTIEKIAIENARYVFPNAIETKIIVTMNIRSLLNFFERRSCRRAQKEIMDLSDEMLRLVKEISPTIFKFAGPSCVRGKCTEGSMSCGSPRKFSNHL